MNLFLVKWIGGAMNVTENQMMIPTHAQAVVQRQCATEQHQRGHGYQG